VTELRASERALNRALWAVVNERFTDAAAEDMWRRPDVVWGLFAVPERDLRVLGDVRGLDVVELACGTAYFSAWLARSGANAVAVATYTKPSGSPSGNINPTMWLEQRMDESLFKKPTISKCILRLGEKSLDRSRSSPKDCFGAGATIFLVPKRRASRVPKNIRR